MIVAKKISFSEFQKTERQKNQEEGLERTTRKPKMKYE
jgi:hypothetical protein